MELTGWAAVIAILVGLTALLGAGATYFGRGRDRETIASQDRQIKALKGEVDVLTVDKQKADIRIDELEDKVRIVTNMATAKPEVLEVKEMLVVHHDQAMGHWGSLNVRLNALQTDMHADLTQVHGDLRQVVEALTKRGRRGDDHPHQDGET